MEHAPPEADIALFADQDVGAEGLGFVLQTMPERLRLVVAVEENAIAAAARQAGARLLFWPQVKAGPEAALEGVKTAFLLWWPALIPARILALHGPRFVNLHPSLLPHNRGKHYNFWSIVEDTPFGVSLHLVDAGIDTGPVLAQSPIDKSWEDTGASLYHKAKAEGLVLFKRHARAIADGMIAPIAQDLAAGSFRLARELEPASELQLDALYRCRDLLNLLRARTFPGHPACFFRDGGRTFEVRVSITQSTARPTQQQD
jgi:methionyl-tRNA formyltransferase